MTMTSPFMEKLKRVPHSIIEKDSIPLVGYPPPFPWEQLSSILGKQLQIKNLQITPAKSVEWRLADKLLEGFGDHPVILNIAVTPIGGELSCLIAEKDFNLLASLLLTQKKDPIVSLGKELKNSFLKFLALEVMSALPSVEFDKSLSGQMTDNTDVPQETCLALDVSVTLQESVIWTRLIFSPDLQKNLKERYARRTVEAPLSRNIDLMVHIEAGRTSISPKEWSTIRPGDFLVLDLCSIEPSGEGRVILTVENTPVFRGKLKNGNIKISESPLYDEVDVDMGTNPPEDQEENEEFEENEEEEVVGFTPFGQEENEEPLEEEEETFVEGIEEEDLVGSDTEEEIEIPEEEKWPPPPERRPSERQEEQPPIVARAEQVEEKKFSPEEIPLSIVVEVGRLQMSVQQLMELQPGNLLELNVHPEDGVNLVVNGKVIAKGELLLVGDALGVRILDI